MSVTLYCGICALTSDVTSAPAAINRAAEETGHGRFIRNVLEERGSDEKQRRIGAVETRGSSNGRGPATFAQQVPRRRHVRATLAARPGVDHGVAPVSRPCSSANPRHRCRRAVVAMCTDTLSLRRTRRTPQCRIARDATAAPVPMKSGDANGAASAHALARLVGDAFDVRTIVAAHPRQRHDPIELLPTSLAPVDRRE